VIDHIPIDVWIAKLSGIAGAVISLNFIKGTWFERVTMALGGSVMSLYISPWIAQRLGLPEGVAGFLVGMLGMAVTAKLWELIQATPIAEIWAEVVKAIRKKLGV
jgi:hypothetical protein